MMIESTVYSIALAIIALGCLAGVFCHKFDDNLIQRVGLSVVCLGACLRLTETFGIFPDDTKARYLFTYGVALYCLGTAWKFWRKT